MRRLLAILSAALIAAAGAGLAQDTGGWTTYRVGDMEMSLPSGANWTVKQDEASLLVGKADFLPYGARQRILSVLVVPHSYPEVFDDWIAEEIAMSYREWEVSDMRANAPFDLDAVEFGEEVQAERTFYFLKFFQISRDPAVSGWSEGRQELYLVFPPDYAQKRIFYKMFFLALCVHPNCGRDDLDVSYLKQTLDSLSFGP